jgi:hypothetical protein
MKTHTHISIWWVLLARSLEMSIKFWCNCKHDITWLHFLMILHIIINWWFSPIFWTAPGAWRYTKVIKGARRVSQKREKLCWKSTGVLMDTLKPARGIKYPWKGSFTNKNSHGKSFTNKNWHLTNKHGDLPMDDTVIIQHIRDNLWFHQNHHQTWGTPHCCENALENHHSSCSSMAYSPVI